MKGAARKKRIKIDESLFGLLSLYKAFNTYIRVLISEGDKKMSLQLTDNPVNWKNIPAEDYKGFRQMTRLEMGVDKLSVKYLNLRYMVKNMGPLLSLKLAPEKVNVINELEEKGYFLLDTSLQYRKKVLQAVNKILTMSPQKKYEIIEKCIAENQEE